jgi:hypothetical protein
MENSETPKVRNLVQKSIPKVNKLDVRCTDCISFEKGPFLYGRACKLNGIVGERPAPNCFNPDFTKLILGSNPMIMHQLGFFLSQFNTSQVRILSSVINRSLSLKKYTKFNFGQEVYINMSGSREFLSNYYKGYVVGYLRANKCVFVSARMSKHKPYTSSIMVMPDTLLSVSEFLVHSKELEESGKIQDPRAANAATVVFKRNGPDNLYEPPTLDTAPSEWIKPMHARARVEDSEGQTKKKKTVTDSYDQIQKFSIDV